MDINNIFAVFVKNISDILSSGIPIMLILLGSLVGMGMMIGYAKGLLDSMKREQKRDSKRADILKNWKV